MMAPYEYCELSNSNRSGQKSAFQSLNGKSSMEARLISDRQRWNDFIAMSPYCKITQSYEWGELASHICTCWNEVVGVSPIILAKAVFLLWLLEAISGELVKEAYPLINRVIAKKSAA